MRFFSGVSVLLALVAALAAVFFFHVPVEVLLTCVGIDGGDDATLTLLELAVL